VFCGGPLGPALAAKVGSNESPDEIELLDAGHCGEADVGQDAHGHGDRDRDGLTPQPLGIEHSRRRLERQPHRESHAHARRGDAYGAHPHAAPIEPTYAAR
jgi:hypothetical protein